MSEPTRVMLTTAELLARADGAAAVVLITVDEQRSVSVSSYGIAPEDVPRLLMAAALQISERLDS